MLVPVLTTFERSMPVNLLTVPEWRYFASQTGRKSWRGAARYYANIRGGAHVLRADGSLMVLTKLQTGKIRQTTYKPGTWAYVKEGVQ